MSKILFNPSAKSVVISVNPHSGASDRMPLVDSLADELRQQGFDPIILGDIPDVQQTAEKLQLENRLRVVVAAGGDGTVSMLANLLPAGTPLAILPLGTENLLAKFLGITAQPKRLATMISEGRAIQMDAGRANGKLFLVMASCGFDAHVVQRLHSQRTGHINHLSYARPILSAIFRYRYPEIRVVVDNNQQHWATRWAFIFNVPRYAMNLPIVTDADATDGKLDVCTFRGGNLLQGLAYLGAILMGRHRTWQDTRFARFSKIRIESDQPVPYQLDGDPGGHLPLEVTVLPKFLCLLVPSDWEAGQSKAGDGLS